MILPLWFFFVYCSSKTENRRRKKIYFFFHFSLVLHVNKEKDESQVTKENRKGEIFLGEYLFSFSIFLCIFVIYFWALYPFINSRRGCLAIFNLKEFRKKGKLWLYTYLNILWPRYVVYMRNISAVRIWNAPFFNPFELLIEICMSVFLEFAIFRISWKTEKPNLFSCVFLTST